ncbi:HAD-IIIC family phosphatase [Stackebrandtia soli]|uniref:HAD-IIIC family phosphatase n=1 Tax=Stackebrandtia soli TaxID=1892856 RepID=UPI0039E8EBDF
MAAPIKCVVWDLDRTLLEGVLLESADARHSPTVRPGMAEVLSTLHERGIVSSVASRNPPELAASAVAAVDWPTPLLAPQFGWGAKSASIRRIADELNIDVDAIAFVDDDPYERAEVASALPDVMTLSPDDVVGALTWPRLRPETVTDEGRRRAESYRDARRRTEAAQDFAGSREEFQSWAGTVLTIRSATTDDVARLAELSVRTNQFNSRASSLSAGSFEERIADDTTTVACIGLSDRFGDDGTIGGVVIDRGAKWTVELIMMSCRAMGRGVIEAMLAWIDRFAQQSNVDDIVVPLRVNDRNVPLRLSLVAAGYRAATPEPGAEALFRRPVPTEPVTLETWVTVESGGT